jgi:hypothetical protein
VQVIARRGLGQELDAKRDRFVTKLIVTTGEQDATTQTLTEAILECDEQIDPVPTRHVVVTDHEDLCVQRDALFDEHPCLNGSVGDMNVLLAESSTEDTSKGVAQKSVIIHE